MNIIQKTKAKIANNASKLYWGVATSSTGMALLSPISTFATATKKDAGIKEVSMTSTDGTMGNLAGIVMNMFKYMGFFLAIWGLGQFIMAWRNDDSDSKVRSIGILLVGLLLYNLKTIFTLLGISL